MKITELSGEYLGQRVLLEHKNWSIEGILRDVSHESAWIDETTLCDVESNLVRGETTTRVDVEGWEKRIDSREARGIEVTLR